VAHMDDDMVLRLLCIYVVAMLFYVSESCNLGTKQA
jgi:hypothetical protein